MAFGVLAASGRKLCFLAWRHATEKLIREGWTEARLNIREHAGAAVIVEELVSPWGPPCINENNTARCLCNGTLSTHITCAYYRKCQVFWTEYGDPIRGSY